MKIILLGAPGAGKGTQAAILSERLSVPVISTGNILKEAIAQKTPQGLAAQGYMDKGLLVPDEVIIGIVKERLLLQDCAGGFILDGVPRTVVQAQALEQLGVEIDKVLSIEVPDEIIIERISGRRVCPDCGFSYHVSDNPSNREGVCDKCGGLLVIRSDDDVETVKTRLRVYHESTEQLKDYYNENGKLRMVLGQKDVADTTRETLFALEG